MRLIEAGGGGFRQLDSAPGKRADDVRATDRPGAQARLSNFTLALIEKAAALFSEPLV
jgi:hypothetical protein